MHFCNSEYRDNGVGWYPAHTAKSRCSMRRVATVSGAASNLGCGV